MSWEEFSEVLGDLTIRVRDKVEKLSEVKI